MGQGLYRCVGFGCLRPPRMEELEEPSFLDALRMRYQAKVDYAMIPFGVDDEWLQAAWNLKPLPPGLPHVGKYEARYARRCRWWPDVGTGGVWVSGRIEAQWDMCRREALQHGWRLPAGKVVVVCDWD
jgi:hypothetical protein